MNMGANIVINVKMLFILGEDLDYFKSSIKKRLYSKNERDKLPLQTYVDVRSILSQKRFRKTCEYFKKSKEQLNFYPFVSEIILPSGCRKEKSRPAWNRVNQIISGEDEMSEIDASDEEMDLTTSQSTKISFESDMILPFDEKREIPLTKRTLSSDEENGIEHDYENQNVPNVRARPLGKRTKQIMHDTDDGEKKGLNCKSRYLCNRTTNQVFIDNREDMNNEVKKGPNAESRLLWKRLKQVTSDDEEDMIEHDSDDEEKETRSLRNIAKLGISEDEEISEINFHDNEEIEYKCAESSKPSNKKRKVVVLIPKRSHLASAPTKGDASESEYTAGWEESLAPGELCNIFLDCRRMSRKLSIVH